MAKRVAGNRRTGRRAAARLAGLALVGLLGGCATLVGADTKAPTIYDLSAPTDFPGLAGRSSAQILVPLPSATDSLSSSRIAVRQAGGEISYLPKVTWSDQVPPLVQTVLIRALENSGRVKAAARPGESLAIDQQVIVDVRAFELDVTAAPAAHVALGVKLLDDRNGHVIATRVIDVRVPSAGDRADAAVVALDKAMDGALQQAVAFVVGRR